MQQAVMTYSGQKDWNYGGRKKITTFIWSAGAVLLLKSLWSGIQNCSCQLGEGTFKNIHVLTHKASDAPWMPTGGRFSKTAIWSVFNLKAMHYFTSLILDDSRSVNEGEC